MSRASSEPAENRKPLVLFICTGNSARSQMAEALLRHQVGDRLEVASAGTNPKGVHPLTHQVMNEMGIDTSAHRSKNTTEFLGKVPVRHAIIVCDSANQHCPAIYPFAAKTHYWPFEDPAAFAEGESGKLAKFREVRDDIDARIRAWLSEIERNA